MSYPRRQRSFWARIKLSVEKFVPRAKRGKFFLTIHICSPVRQALQYDVEALKNKIDEKRTIQQLLYNCHFYIFYILRSEFYRLRQNSNWTFKNLLHCEPVATRLVSALWPTFLKIRLRSFPLGSDASGVKTIWQIQKRSMAFRKLFFSAHDYREVFFRQDARRGPF